MMNYQFVLGTAFVCFFFPKKKKGNKLQSTPKYEQNKGQKTKTNMHSHPTEMLSQHSHTQLSSLHTNQKCRDDDDDEGKYTKIQQKNQEASRGRCNFLLI